MVPQTLARNVQAGLLGRGVDARIVEQEVHAREAQLRDGGAECVDRGCRRRVAFQNVDLAGAAGDEVLQVREVGGLRAHGGDDGVGRRGGELAHEFQSQPAVGAGDDVGGHAAGDGRGVSIKREDWLSR